MNSPTAGAMTIQIAIRGSRWINWPSTNGDGGKSLRAYSRRTKAYGQACALALRSFRAARLVLTDIGVVLAFAALSAAERFRAIASLPAALRFCCAY